MTEPTYVDHEQARPPFYRKEEPLSDQAIARAVWGFVHCQYHGDLEMEMCRASSAIIHEAERIQRGEKSWYEIESARYEAMNVQNNEEAGVRQPASSANQGTSTGLGAKCP